MFEIVDSVGMRFSILNAVCTGTTCDQAWILRESENLGSPSSHACLRAFVHGWTRCAGLSFFGAIEEHTMGVCSVRPLPRMVWRSDLLDWELEQIGRVERRVAMLEKMMSKVRESMDMILSECLNATNEMTRHGGCCSSTMGTLTSSSQSCNRG